MSTITKGGGGESNNVNNSDNLYKLVPKLNENEMTSCEYIKRLENEKDELNQKLIDKCKLIKDLNEDLKRMESERLLCMIYESYQRFKVKISEDLELKLNEELKDGMKIEAFFEAVKKGKIVSNDRLVNWIIEIDNTKGIQLLKDFRNDYSHYTNNDLSILRQWRTRLIEVSENESILKSADNLINGAALNILNTLIDYNSRPESRTLQSKRRLRSTDLGQDQDQVINANIKNYNEKFEEKTVLDSISNKQRKKLKKLRTSSFGEGEVPEVSSKLESFESTSSSSTCSSSSNQNDKTLFQIYHRNSEQIGKLRKNGEINAQKMAEIRKLRLENKRIVKEKGNDITFSLKKKNKKK